MSARIGAIAAAALIGGSLAARAEAAASPWIGDANAAVRLLTATAATGAARRLGAGIEFRLAPGWHTYWRSPGDAGVAPRFDWRGSHNLARATLAWPAPRRFSQQGLDTIGYRGDVVLPVTVMPARPGRKLTLHLTLDYAACAAICVPHHAVLTLALPAGPTRPTRQAAAIARFAARVPEDPKAAAIVLKRVALESESGRLRLRVRLASTGAPFVAPDLFVEGAAGASFGRPEVVLSDHGRAAVLTVPVSGVRGADLSAEALVLTLVDGRRAAEIPVLPSPAGGADAALRPSPSAVSSAPGR